MATTFTTHHYNAPSSDHGKPTVALLVTTYQKPRHLRLALASIRLQKFDATMEIVVVDDGSTDETFEIVEQFARDVPWSVKSTTHVRKGFQVARCRNEGVSATSAPYLIFLDGDCIAPVNFIQEHLDRRRPGAAMFSETFRLEEEVSAKIDEAAIRTANYTGWVSPAELARLQKFDRKARWHTFFRHPSKPHLVGCNVGVWRSDYEMVNGYDENFEGWGQEDDDFGDRLRQFNVRIKSIFRWARTYHIWHPRDTTRTKRWKDGVNVPYYLRKDRSGRCLNGLFKPAWELHEKAPQETMDFDEVPTILAFPTAPQPVHRPASRKAA